MKTLIRAIATTLVLFCMAVPLQALSSSAITPDVVYGHKAGMALTFDVFRPAGAANGAGILNMVSGIDHEDFAFAVQRDSADPEEPRIRDRVVESGHGPVRCKPS